MADCECLPKCPFFNDRMMTKPATAQLLKTQYCHGDNSSCARHQVFLVLGSAGVPADLYPVQVDKVTEIISKARAAT